MVSTIQLFLALGHRPVALVADLVATVAVVAVVAVVARARRPQATVTADADSGVVAEAEDVVSGAHHRQPA